MVTTALKEVSVCKRTITAALSIQDLECNIRMEDIDEKLMETAGPHLPENVRYTIRTGYSDNKVATCWFPATLSASIVQKAAYELVWSSVMSI